MLCRYQDIGEEDDWTAAARDSDNDDGADEPGGEDERKKKGASMVWIPRCVIAFLHLQAGLPCALSSCCVLIFGTVTGGEA